MVRYRLPISSITSNKERRYRHSSFACTASQNTNMQIAIRRQWDSETKDSTLDAHIFNQECTKECTVRSSLIKQKRDQRMTSPQSTTPYKEGKADTVSSYDEHIGEESQLTIMCLEYTVKEEYHEYQKYTLHVGPTHVSIAPKTRTYCTLSPNPSVDTRV